MSEDEEIVLASITAFNDADWEALERLWEPDGVVVGPPDWPESGDIVGWPAIREQFERLKADWSEDHITPERVEEIGPGVTLTRMRWTVTGAASGVPVEVSMWMVARIRNGRYYRGDYFQEEAAARAAAEA